MDLSNYPALSPISTEQKARIASALLGQLISELRPEFEEYQDEIAQFDETRGVIAFFIAKLNYSTIGVNNE